MNRVNVPAIGWWLAAFPFAQAALAQQSTRDSLANRSEAAVAVAGSRYAAGKLQRALLGNDYRNLWTLPITVPKLDIAHVGGGLRPVEKGGSMQTRSLRFRGANKREYVFRSVEKDPARGMSPDLQNTLVSAVVQDQVSAYHPAAALVVSSLLDATDILHARPRLVVMPDDSMLGAFRQEFSGMLGTFEERAGEHFVKSEKSAGALEVISSDKLFKEMLEDNAVRFDDHAYLAARLFDIWVGDRDRHRDQWRWARFQKGKKAVWQPIPRDRDMAFARMEGLAPAAIRTAAPRFVTFGNTYPPMEWLNWNAREIDRRLMGALSRAAWDSAAVALQLQMTDSVMRNAVGQMPEPYAAASGDQLIATLRARLAKLPAAAAEYYEVLAREAEIRGSDKAEHVKIAREANGSVWVEITPICKSQNEKVQKPFFSRYFLPEETKEIRIHGEGGDDRVTIVGESSTSILVRVIGGNGADLITDSVPSGDRAIRVYDSAGNDRFVTATQQRIDTRVYSAPTIERPEDAPRDWGSFSYYMPAVRAQAGTGLVLGASHAHIQYGFRSAPYVYSSTLKVDASPSESRARVAWSLDAPRGDRSTVGVDMLASGLDLIRYYGIGNETSSDASTSYYRSLQTLYRIEPRGTLKPSRRLALTGSVFGSYTVSSRDKNTLLREERPYGVGDFGQVGLRASIVVDHRDSAVTSTDGFRLAASTSFVPNAWSVQEAFGSVSASGTAYRSFGEAHRSTFAARLGGRHSMGRVPVQEASKLGGVQTLRGFDEQRFTGRSMLYGGAEYRLTIVKINVIVPTRIGALAFGDAGRVFADHESSSQWHTSYGGGVWATPFLPQYTVNLSVGKSRERVALYLSNGFAF